MGKTPQNEMESIQETPLSELVVLFSLKQEASASIGGGTFT